MSPGFSMKSKNLLTTETQRHGEKGTGCYLAEKDRSNGKLTAD